jgi:hypothetical protein
MDIIHHVFAVQIIKDCDIYVFQSTSNHFNHKDHMLEHKLQTVSKNIEYSDDVSDHFIETNTQDGNNMGTNHNTHYKNMMHT